MQTNFKAIVIASLAFLIQFTVQSQQVARSIPNSTSPDGLIGFWEFRPPDYGTQKHPLIIFLHGAGEVGNGTTQLPVVAYNALPATLAQGNVSMKFTYNGVASSFVVISPQLSAAYGYWPSFYITEIIKYAKANLQIDPNRIYLTGLSLGGGGVWRTITDAGMDPSFDSNIAAVAPICATPEENDGNFCNTVGANHLPIWAFHCMDDTRVSVGVTQHVETVSRNCGVSPASKFTYYATGNHSGAWILAYDFGHITRQLADGTNYTFTQNLYEWFLSNSRSNTTPPPTNTPPTVTVSAAQIITLPLNSVTISGTGAGTNGATISSYAWTQTSGPAGPTITAPGSTSTTVTGLTQGNYVFTFKVTDNHGLSSTGTVSVTVNAAPVNTPPITTVGNAQVITLPISAVTISGTGTGTNGATISSYAWTQAGGPPGAIIVSPGSTSTLVTTLAQGVYVFKLTVTDNHGLSSSGTISVTVNAAAGNTPPVVTVSNAQIITLPLNSVNISGTGTGTNGATISSYAWTQTSGPAGSVAVIATPAATSTSVTGLVQGNYVFTFKVTDNHGLSATGTVSITVNPATGVNQPPISKAGDTAAVTTSSVTLDGTASSDPDGRIVEYYWAQISGPNSSVIADNFAGTTTASGLVNGTYTYILQVKDNSGALAYSNKVVNVAIGTPPPPPPPPPTGNQLPISNAGNPLVITLPANSAVLDASASYDPDGNIIQYYWAQVSGPSPSVIANSLGASTTVSGLVMGVYMYLLQVKDNSYALAYSTKTITVNASGARVGAADADPIAASETLRLLGDGSNSLAGKTLGMYPNPVINTSTIELLSTENADVKKIAVYNASGILIASYRWPTVKGRNTWTLKNIAGLAKGLYIIHVTDSKGKTTGTLKFVKA